MTRGNNNIEPLSQELLKKLSSNNIVVVTAPPGAGKSTILPLGLLTGIAQNEKILMLEPRRLATRQIAERLAYNLGESVGETVGYRVRFENKVTAKTRLEVLTEGILTRKLVADPTLDGVQMVVFDEFHERSLASDVALALTREAQQTIRPDLKIIIMSATIDTTTICEKLNAPLVEMSYQGYRVDVHHVITEEFNENSSPLQIATSVAKAVQTAHEKHTGDILAFLPGQGEINLCQELLGEKLGKTHICPLYGLLDNTSQRHAIAPSIKGERKVVLATPIAETSITIEGVRVVVDSGLYRKMQFNPQSGLSTMVTARISMDMATQRTGRAGRVADGTCYRLWSMATEHRLENCRKPEIVEADLAPTLLDISTWGGGDMQTISWLTPPPPSNVTKAAILLQQLNAINNNGAITLHGKRLSALPCHPRISQMLVLAKGNEMRALAADIAALLEEKDPMSQYENNTDINTRITALREMRQSKRLKSGWKQIARIAEQYRRIVGAKECNEIPQSTHSGLLLALAYPERIATAQQSSQGRFMVSYGNTIAFVDRNDEIAAHEWISIGNMNAGNGKIFLASPFDPRDLFNATLLEIPHESSGCGMVKTRINISWDNKKGQLVARNEKRIGSLIFEAKPLQEIDKENAVEVICNAAKKYGTSMLDFNDQVQNLQRRVTAVTLWHKELDLPDLSTEAVLQRTEEWLPMYLKDENGRLRTTTQDLKKIDLVSALWSLLSWEQQNRVESLAPSHITVPTGSHIKLEYRQGAELPILRVRLQECFGLTDTPRINDGKSPILMELLSPGYKPVQLTQDLRSFWQNTYFEVRKELKRRYPKHAWPDNPIEAKAVRGVKRKDSN